MVYTLLLSAVGAVVLLGLGFFIGRRTGYQKCLDNFYDLIEEESFDAPQQEYTLAVQSINGIPMLALQYLDADNEMHIFVEDEVVGDICRLYGVNQEGFIAKFAAELETETTCGGCPYKSDDCTKCPKITKGAKPKAKAKNKVGRPKKKGK